MNSLDHEISVQRAMVKSLQTSREGEPMKPWMRGPLFPIRTRAFGTITLGELFDHYARGVLAIEEVEARARGETLWTMRIET